MFERRGLIIHPHELTETWIQRLPDLGINVLGLHPVGGADADQTLGALVDMMRDSTFQKKLDKVRALEIQVEFEVHALSYLMPRSLFADHPNWFHMDKKGDRVADFNLCASDLGALQYLKHSAARLAEALPSDSHRYYFWLDDLKDGACHCPMCRSLSPSDQQMICLNTMLHGIREVDSQAKLAFLSYCDTLTPPTVVKPEDGIFMEFAPFQRRLDRPMCDSDCPENAMHLEKLKESMAFFGTEDAQILEYWLDNSMFSGWHYPPQPIKLNDRIIKDDVQFYRSLGFRSITTFACYLGDDYEHLYGRPDLSAYAKAFDDR